MKKRKLQLGGFTSDDTVTDDMFGEGSTTIYDNINQKVDNQQAFKNKVGNALPYITNAINAFSKLPKPAAPVQEQTITPDLVSFNADKLDIDKQFRGLTKGIDELSSNPGMANANKVAMFSKILDAKGRLSQQEGNLNASINNDAKRTNSIIKARNVERTNDFNDALTSRKLRQQQMRMENLADVSNKVQLNRRDNDLMSMEDRKLDILEKKYRDTGVLNRNLYDEMESEMYNKKKKFGGRLAGRY